MPKKETEKTSVDTPESKIKEISADVKTQIKTGERLVNITTAEDVATATTFLGGIKGRLKKIEDLRTAFVKPLNDHVKTINAMFKEQSQPLEVMEAKVKRAIADFKLEEERKARIEEARLEKIRETANAKREAEGKEQILTPVKTVERSEQTINTDAGRSTAKKVWKFKVVDIDKVPRKYLRCEVKHSEVVGAINAGITNIEGLEIYEDFDVSVTAK